MSGPNPRLRLIPGPTTTRSRPEYLPPSQQLPDNLDGQPLPVGPRVHTHVEPFKEHDWNGDRARGGSDPNAPSWLNDFDTGSGRICAVCGVMELTGKTIRADQAGWKYLYKDAWGNEVRSPEPLPCPLFIGQTNGAVMDGRVKTRVLTGRMNGVEGRVESIEERLDRLEVENVALKQRLEEATVELDADRVIEWLAEQVRQRARSAPALAPGAPAALPEPVEDLIDVLGIQSPERETVPVRKKPSGG